jgi:hypothetical protein
MRSLWTTVRGPNGRPRRTSSGPNATPTASSLESPGATHAVGRYGIGTGEGSMPSTMHSRCDSDRAPAPLAVEDT